MIRNTHERVLDAPPAEIGTLIDGLASDGDRLWPKDRWPPMRLDGPLRVGVSGGHGSIRYAVSHYEPGRRVRFRFDPRLGLVGHHEFAAASRAGRTTLRHTLVATPRGRMRIAWPLILRWLHDALIEDALDRAEGATTGTPVTKRRWSLWVRLLRAVLRSRRRPVGLRQDR
ncbi:MAG TPA: hypothetical protein VFM13_04775 [Gaiellaceae bacterium]|nr:hypothetical protein [Gaiellaceae bacterium]